MFEIQFTAGTVHQKFEADEYWHHLKQHYGHVGEVFMRHVLQHRASVEARVRETMKSVDQAASIQSSERFWSAAIASVLVAGEIAQQLGLLRFNVDAIRTWALTKQIPAMRGVVLEEYSSPLSTLADFLETINGEILIANTPQHHANIANVIRAPRGQLLAHYDTDQHTMWVLQKGFKDYCVRSGANYLKILNELGEERLDNAGRPSRIITGRVRKVLGLGTEFAKAQSWCFAINMKHPAITGAVDMGIVPPSTTAPALLTKKRA